MRDGNGDENILRYSVVAVAVADDGIIPSATKMMRFVVMITAADEMNSPIEYKNAHCCSFLSIFVYHYEYTFHLPSLSLSLLRCLFHSRISLLRFFYTVTYSLFE